jgi:hypothetical protein
MPFYRNEHFPQGLLPNAPCSALGASFESAREEMAEMWLIILSFRARSLVTTDEMARELEAREHIY